MNLSFTTRMLLSLLVIAGTVAGTARAQDAEPLGDDFIFFVNGTNTLLPAFDGAVIDDPADAENKVLQYGYGNWSFQAFRWDAATGVDMTANADSGDVLHLRLLVDPSNAGMPGVSLMFEDKTDGSGANDGTADLPFRLLWQIPEEMRNGEWWDLEIPLPPRTYQELEDAKTAGTLDPMAENWLYGGAWSTGGFGVAISDGLGPGTADNPQLWQEFEWGNVQNFGMFWDNNTGGGPVWVDDVYIGAAGLDLSAANNPAGAMSGVTFGGDGDGNTLTWAANPEFGGYNVYFSEEEITDVTAPGVSLLAALAAADEDAGMFSVLHRFEIPHESLMPLDGYYAVTSLSQFGVENPDISMSASVISNPDLPVQPSIIQLTDQEGEMLFDNLGAGIASGEGFPAEYQPFVLDSNHSQLSESLTLPDDDSDLSGTFWVGYTDFNELWVYAEIVDDVVELPGVNVDGGNTWMFDSIEMGFGNYDVRDAGGTILSGSTHQDMLRGDFADYQFRISAHSNANGEIEFTTPYVGWSLNAVPQGAGAVYDVLQDDSGLDIGYKMLILIPLDGIQNADEGDAVLDPPAMDEIRFVPMTFSLNDADGSGRVHQITWSLKNTVTNQWWNTPAQWATIAMVGRSLVVLTSIETVDAEVPQEYSLEQNYPNPFNPQTTIRFALNRSETVNLAVYDLLGRKVATLIDGQPIAAGTHEVSFDATDLASGLYLYRLEAEGFTQTRQMMLLK